MIFNSLTFFVSLFYLTVAENSKRVYNGFKAVNEDFPFVGLLRDFSDGNTMVSVCSATLLDSETILTNAHCFCYNDETLNDIDPLDFSMVFGSVNNSDTQWRKTSLLSEIYIHESFLSYEKKCETNFTDQARNFVYDIAVGKLLDPIPYNRSIQPVQLSRTAYRRGKMVIIAGFGEYSNNSKNLEDQLYWGEGKVCQERGDIHIICIECLKFEASIGKGDSGGPIIDMEDNTTQIGIMVGGISNKRTLFLPSYKIFDWVYRNNQFRVHEPTQLR